MQTSYRMDIRQYHEMVNEHVLSVQKRAKLSKADAPYRKYEVKYKGDTIDFRARTQTEAREQFEEIFGVSANGIRFKRVTP